MSDGHVRALEPAPCSCSLRLEAGPTAPIRVLRVDGDVDLATLAALHAALDAASAATDGHPVTYLVIDLSGLTFCSVSGLALLHEAAAGHGAGLRYLLCGMSAHLARVAGLLWPDGHPMRHLGLPAGITALRLEQTHRVVPRRRIGCGTGPSASTAR